MDINKLKEEQLKLAKKVIINDKFEKIETVSSKVKGFVKYSMEKYIKVFQFILAMAQPQWNMPWGSKMDYDTNAQSVTPHESVDNESLKQNVAYSSIRYRT